MSNIRIFYFNKKISLVLLKFDNIFITFINDSDIITLWVSIKLFYFTFLYTLM